MALLNCETVRGAYEYPGIEVFGVATLLWDRQARLTRCERSTIGRVARNIRGSNPKSGIMDLGFS
jgi:hypothetical protein